jgi:hypothetical protein
MRKILFFVLLSTAWMPGTYAQSYAALHHNRYIDLFKKVADDIWSTPDCGCDFTVKGDQVLDNTKMGVKPGQTVCFSAGTYSWLYIQNFKGAPGLPITFKNACDGKVIFNGGTGGSRVVWAINDQFIHFTGTGNPSEFYGIEITGGGQGIDFRDRSSDIEFDHVYGHDIGYSFFNAKTDPVCGKPETQRGGFTMYNISYHDNKASNIKTGEAAYVGESHYVSGFKAACGILQEHDVVGVQFYNNTFENIGRDGIQVGSAISGLNLIYNNDIKNFGMTKEYGQGSGITINPGSIFEVYNNRVDTGSGYGILAQGPGGSKIHNNLIINTGWTSDGGGIMLAVYGTPVGNYQVYSNTLVGVNRYGVEYFCSMDLKNNVIEMASGTPLKASSTAKITDTGNVKTTDLLSLKLDVSFVPTETSPVTLGVGYKDYVKPPPKIIREDATSELITTDGVEEWFLVTPSGKRKKIN